VRRELIDGDLGPLLPTGLLVSLEVGFIPVQRRKDVAGSGARGFHRIVTMAVIGMSSKGGVPGQRPVEIVRFYVDAAWHGSGVAAALTAACEGEARRRGADARWLSVWQEAPRPLAFYRRAGFEIVGTATFAFGDRLDDDFLIARRLAGAEVTAPSESRW
jgi:ribosomal protein S18 acetylase RimI-like enzyme